MGLADAHLILYVCERYGEVDGEDDQNDVRFRVA